MQYLRKYISKYWRDFFAAVAFLTLEAMCDLMQPTIMSKIVDIGVANKQMNYVLRMGGLMLLITGVGAIAASSRNIISSKVSQKFGVEIRGDLFRKVKAFNRFEYEKKRFNRANNELGEISIKAMRVMAVFSPGITLTVK